MIKTKLKMWALLLLMLIAMPVMADDFNSQRMDFRDESIYFMITTRFYDGDPKNNVLCWDNKQCQIDTGDPCWRGDFQGVIDKLDYIKALGFTAIWITPVVQNASGYDYHGYHAMDFTHVDCRYQSGDGSKSGDVMFQELIDKAHAKGIKIILDIVLNHTGNFGEENLCKEFKRNAKLRNQAEIEACMIPNSDVLGSDYLTILGKDQYQRRLALMKNTDGQNHDIHNYWHHTANNWNWDFP
ncbi:alpha-amylase family glycosyl hydrolase, partial [Prevotella sp.]|uniref:alpha-amylase family glycosyl hydrolase n=1 Tax=Prevotella sp. TaxID=59823 RepID=UPI0025E0A478